MSKNNNSTRSPEHQALIADIYLKLIPYVIGRIKNLKGLSENEARAKSAIKNKLSKLGTDGRHELVANFIANKMAPYLNENPDVVLTWDNNKGTIVRIFENDLIDQYRHVNTNQSRFEASHQMLDVSGWDLINTTTSDSVPGITEDIMVAAKHNDYESTISAKFNSYCESLDKKDRYILEGMVLAGLTSVFLSKALGMHEDSVLRRKKQLLKNFRSTIVIGDI